MAKKKNLIVDDPIILDRAALISDDDRKFLNDTFIVYGFPVELPETDQELLDKVDILIDRVVSDMRMISHRGFIGQMYHIYSRLLKIYWTCIQLTGSTPTVKL